MPEVAKMRYTHDAMIETILARPEISQGELARLFGYTETWISIVVNSDAFQAKMSEMKAIFIDPQLKASIEDRMKGMVTQSLDILNKKLEATQDPQMALKALEIGGKYLGMGQQRQSAQVGVFVAVMPPVAASSDAWQTQSSKEVAQLRETSEREREIRNAERERGLFADRTQTEDAVIRQET